MSIIHFDRQEVTLIRHLFGVQEEHRKLMERAMGVVISGRGEEVQVEGPEQRVGLAQRVMTQLLVLIKEGYRLRYEDVDQAIKMLDDNPSMELKTVFLDTVYVATKDKSIAPKNLSQKHYVDTIRHHDIVISIGPAGTGKTYLAMAMAVSALMKKELRRIILTRPAVEAGEKLGFLPGDLYEKVNPYLRPLYDALHDMMEIDQASALLSKGMIEVAPLAFMRGRTLNDSFVILDEAQNTTSEQMKMFLTRLGYNARAVVTGDITQIDLPPGKTSGLIEIQTVLHDINDIEFVYFSEKDVVRHRLVQDIITAYDRFHPPPAMASNHQASRSKNSKKS